MAEASSLGPAAPAGTVDAREAAHFGAMAAEWWDPRGSSAMLHRLNPPRLAYLRAQIDAHWAGDPGSFAPLAGRRALDMGCGAGLLAEPLARLGAAGTGVDASAEVIAAARAHAGALSIDYRVGGVEAVAGERFDLVTSLEVIEHVSEPRTFVQGLADALAEDGLLILSTPNRTAMSRLMLIMIGEGTGRLPRGTHDWEKFLAPEELTALLKDAGLEVLDCTGLAWNPAGGFHLSDNKSLDYFITARRAR